MIAERTCPKCKKTYNDPSEMEFIDRTGECFMCDHVYGEAITAEKAEAEEEE